MNFRSFERRASLVSFYSESNANVAQFELILIESILIYIICYIELVFLTELILWMIESIPHILN